MLIFLIILFVSFSAHADQNSYDQGKALAQQLDQGIQEGIPEGIEVISPENVPETHFKENFHELSEAATSATHESELGSYVLESQKTTKAEDYRVTEDSEIIQNANDIVADPMKFIGGEEEHEEGGVREVVESTHLCEESAEEATYTCDQTRHINLKKKTEQRYEKTEYFQRSIFGRSYSPQHSSYSYEEVKPWSRTTYGQGGYTEGQTNIYKTVQVLTSDANEDSIEDSCNGYEEESNKGLCRYGAEEIIEGPETREFCEGDECISVTREWWKKRRTYHCKYPSKDNCGPFRAAGCDQVEAQCLKKVGGVCVNNRKTFLCRSVALGNGQVRFKGDVPFCMDGNCDEHSWAANKDFADAMSKLSMFQEMSKDMGKNPLIFRGEAMKCSKATMSFQDCCGSGGWGRSVGLGQNCSESEKNLKKERSANKCVRVGTYCSDKQAVTNICLTKKTSFCCFGSKLSKLLQEQGRAQLGIGWGDAEHPDCRPMTIDEIKRIDFSRIDFSVLYEEIRAKTSVESVSTAATGLGGRWDEKIKAAQSKHGEKIKASELYNTKENPDASL
ncbi:MAG TPA: hypothetical protein DD412_03395 [Holosporales bacterium]|nr:hypothetical protein [Holosporales bacterium]